MKTIGLILMLWSCHALIAGVLSAPIVFLARKRARWQVWESVVFVLPFAFWMLVSIFGSQPKSMANLVECFYLAVAIPLAALARVVMGVSKQKYMCPWLCLLTLCGIAIATYVVVPALPE